MFARVETRKLISCLSEPFKLQFLFRKMSVQLISSSKCFDGEQRVYSHSASSLGCDMKFGIYLPPGALKDGKKFPALYFLSGLTCTHENFIQKSGMQKYAAEHQLIVINPDTSPRNVNLPGEDDAYDFGSGASFYVDATKEPWAKHYKMYSYVTKELISVINSNFPVLCDKIGIFGHSMGGHGALICALKNPGLYRSLSAFAPIANPSQCPWGQKAFAGYLGATSDDWKQWDATELARCYTGPLLKLLIDQGESDDFLKQGQLLTKNLLDAIDKNDSLESIKRFRSDYDHSYYYVATFMCEHFDHHSKFLNADN